MSSVDINGTLLRKELTLTIIEQRVLPQRNLAPLHKTQMLPSRDLVNIRGSARFPQVFRMSFSQLSEARAH
jgi:hypothetical protein